jgi:DNA-binding GntR family transcriptional regulator
VGTQGSKSGAKLTSQLLAEQLRREIVQGVYKPGQQLVEDRLAEQYGVSRIPVREALRLLGGQGFVGTRPYAGTFVAFLTKEDAADLLEIRGALEPLAASRAAVLRNAEHLRELREILAQGCGAVDAGQLDLLPGLNATFHGLLIDASANRTLKQIIVQLQDKIAWVYSAELPRRAADSWAEHRLILYAVEQGDADSARALMAAHIRSAEDAYRLRDGVADEADLAAADGASERRPPA